MQNKLDVSGLTTYKLECSNPYCLEHINGKKSIFVVNKDNNDEITFTCMTCNRRLTTYS